MARRRAAVIDSRPTRCRETGAARDTRPGARLPAARRAVPRVMRGTHATMREVALFQTRQVTIRSLDGPLLLHLEASQLHPDAAFMRIRLEQLAIHVQQQRPAEQAERDLTGLEQGDLPDRRRGPAEQKRKT